MEETKITPVDIKHKEFKSGMFGYDKDEVNQYLELVSEEMELIIRKEETTRKLLEDAESKPKPVIEEKPKKIEPTLAEKENLISQTLMQAEKIKQQILSEAHSQKRSLITEAKEEAKNILEEARHHLNLLENQYLDIKEEKKEFLLKFRTELQELMGKINNDTVLNSEMEQRMDEDFKGLKEKEQKIREATLSE